MKRRDSRSFVDAPQLTFDLLLILMSFMVSSKIYSLFKEEIITRRHIWMMVLFAVIFLFFMGQCRMYDITSAYRFTSMAAYTILATIFTGLSISLVIFLLKLDTTSRFLFLLFCFFSTASIIVQRAVRRVFLKNRPSRISRSALFVGGEEEFHKCRRYLEQTGMGIQILECIPFSHYSLDSPDTFEEFLVGRQVDEVFFLYGLDCSVVYEEFLLVCNDMGITVRLLLDFYKLPVVNRSLGYVDEYPALMYNCTCQDQVQLYMKTVMDVTMALLGLILLSPVMLVTAVAIKLESPGPVIFKQKRAGLNGKVFEIYKFRSMRADAEERKTALLAQNKILDGMMFKMDNDPRVTKVGSFIRRTSIDELPQLFNVLKGDMSLVGTRPPTLDEVKKYKRSHRRRISIRPGITGMWQVNGRSDILEFEQVVALDKQYIDQWSLALDFRLIFQTIIVMITQRGAK